MNETYDDDSDAVMCCVVVSVYVICRTPGPVAVGRWEGPLMDARCRWKAATTARYSTVYSRYQLNTALIQIATVISSTDRPESRKPRIVVVCKVNKFSKSKTDLK